MQKKETSPSRQLDQFLLRMPNGMKAKLNSLAKINHRTVTAEIISRLEESLCDHSDNVRLLIKEHGDTIEFLEVNDHQTKYKTDDVLELGSLQYELFSKMHDLPKSKIKAILELIK